MENNFKNYEPLSCNLDNIANQLCLSKNCSIYLNIPPPLCVCGGGDRIWQPEEKEIFLVTE